MATIRKGILSSQKIPESIDPDLKIYGVDGLPTKSEHMPNLNVVRTDDAVGMTPADFHNVFPFNEIINENVSTFVEYGQWDEKYNTFSSQGNMVSTLSRASTSGNGVYYEHLFAFKDFKPAQTMYGHAMTCKIYVKDPNNRYKYILASGTKFGKPIDFENCVYQMDNMDAYLQDIMEEMDTSYVYPRVRYGFLFILVPSTAVSGYIHHDGTEWVLVEENTISFTDSYLQIFDNSLPKQEITTSSVFKTLNDNKYWRYNGGTSYTIADFDEIPIPLTPTKRIPKFYVKRGMNPDGTWYEKISKTKHDETWLCHKAFISDDDGLEKPYLYLASEIVTTTYRDLREDRGNFKVYGETEYDMFETLFRIAYASWMSTYDEDDMYVIADLKEFGIEYLDCVLRVDTKYDEVTESTSLDGVGFGRPFELHDDPFGIGGSMAMRVSNLTTFRNVKGQGASSLSIPENEPDDGAMYNFNEIEINGNDIFKYVSIVNGHDDPNPVIRQSINEDIGQDAFIPITYQALANDIGVLPGGNRKTLFDENVSFEGEVEGLSLYSGDGVDELYDLLASGGVIEGMPFEITMNDTEYYATYEGEVTGEFPNPVYVVVDQGYNPFLVVLDSIDLGMPLGKVIAFVGNALEYSGIENLNYLKIEVEELLTLRDFEYILRSGNLWQFLALITEEPAFLEKQDKFNPATMELHTYTKTNNMHWSYGYDGYQQQPNHVGIGTGMQSFLGYLMMLYLLVDQGAGRALLRTKYLNAEFFQYDTLLYPVKTRLVMLP